MAERLDHLDGLRGIAALLVLYQHGVEHWAAAVPDAHAVQAHLQWLFTYLDLGKVGVVAFFAISGFIVPASLRGDSPRLGFVVSRLCRLFPAYWLAVVGAALVLPAFAGQTVSLLQLLANLSMAPALWGQADLLGIFWTLRVEWVFYGLCLLVFSLGRLDDAAWMQRLLGALLAYALGASLLRGAGLVPLPVALPLYLAVMLFGHQLRLALLARDALARRRWPALLAALAVLIPLCWTLAYDDNSHKESLLASCSGFLAGLALFVACVCGRRFGSALLSHLGRISYGIYLFHPIALALLLGAAQAPLQHGPLRALLAVALTLLLAQWVQQGLEQPAIRLGRRLLPGRRGERPLERRA
ncbi:MAG: acyltransferase [Roseateles sp.]|nr:MAG: acyltransferase [Roseateles sp.]